MTLLTLTRSVNRFAPLLFSIAMLLLFCVASGCSKPETAKEPVASVQTTPAQKAPISQIVSAEAVVFPLQQAVIVPKITSTIKTFLVQRGDKVHKGQLLAVLENKDLSAAAEQSKGEFQQAEAGYVSATGATIPQQLQKAELDASSAKTALDAQQKVYDSRKSLFEQGALPRRDLDAATVALAQAKSQYEIAQKQLEDLKRLGETQALKTESGKLTAAKGKYNSAAAMLSYSQITSPINGVVTDRPLFPGELATANQPLITLMDTSRLIAKAHVAQAEAATLKVGNPAEVKVAGVDEPMKGRITLVSPALDPGSTTIEVWVEATKPDPAMRPGTTVEVSMTAKTAEDAVVVPAAAVFKNPEGADYVVLAGSDGHAHVKLVQVGIRTTYTVQIASGVNPGDLVITTGGYALPDKTQIKIEAAAPPEKGGGAKADNPAESATPGTKAQD
ncbi:MAG TPA: efflux RND transporter periplasmic adaptor subunit [Candidatus Dormibacteraeota bacterium]|nr:efflux RND transporter periplasmic adaptor subunit [Candidatus Dormibacteraeota bacterium]